MPPPTFLTTVAHPAPTLIDAAPSQDDDDEFLQSLRHHELERQRDQHERRPRTDHTVVPETPLSTKAHEGKRDEQWPPLSWREELQKMRKAMEEKDRQLAKVNQRLNHIWSIDIDQSPQQWQPCQRRRADPKKASDPLKKQPARPPAKRQRDGQLACLAGSLGQCTIRKGRRKGLCHPYGREWCINPPPTYNPPDGSSIADWLRVRGVGYKWGGVVSPLVAWIQIPLHLQTSFILL